MAKSQTLKIFKMRIGDPIYAFFGIAGFSLYALSNEIRKISTLSG